MNLPTFTPATRARLMIAMNEALSVLDDDTTSQEAAFVSAVTHSESPGATLLIAEAVEGFLDAQTADMGVQNVIVDPSALYAGYDRMAVCTAMKLAGLHETRVSGSGSVSESGNVWANCISPTVSLPVIHIPETILQDWIAPI